MRAKWTAGEGGGGLVESSGRGNGADGICCQYAESGAQINGKRNREVLRGLLKTPLQWGQNAQTAGVQLAVGTVTAVL
jgi:hypothetical protein